MAGETSAAGARRNIQRAAVHPDMPRSDSHPTEISHRVDSQFLTPPPQVGPAHFLDYFQTEEQIEEALTVLRERRRIRITQTPALPTLVQATKRKLKNMLVEHSDESPQPAHETTRKDVSVFSRLGKDPVRQSGAPNYKDLDSDSRSPSRINPKRHAGRKQDIGDGGAQSCNTDFVHAIVVLDPDMVERVGKICVAARSDGVVSIIDIKSEVASFKSKSLAKSKQGSKSTTPKNTIHDAGSQSEDSSHKNLLLDYTVGGHSAAVSSVTP
ncbi:hypothetical protein OROGR_012102 [Orobanche gracilis]